MFIFLLKNIDCGYSLEPPRCAKSDDLVLYHRISLIKDFIIQCNDRRGVQSPVFKLDLLNDRKRAGKEVRKSITFRQYLDGVHPGELLAEVWLKRIVEMTVIEG